MARYRAVLDKDQVVDVVRELLNTSNAVGIDFHFTAEMDTLPTIEYTITRYILPKKEDNADTV